MDQTEEQKTEKEETIIKSETDNIVPAVETEVVAEAEKAEKTKADSAIKTEDDKVVETETTAVDNEKNKSDDNKIAEFRAGDTVKISVRIQEGDKERLQIFEGVVISKRGRGESKTFIVRKIGVGGIGVERIWPLNSPSIHSIQVTKKCHFTRAKLYYLRQKVGKAALRVREEKNTKTKTVKK